MIPTRPFRFGTVVALRGPAASWIDAAIAAEDAGYATLLTPDTLGTPSPFPVLAAIAAGTTALRLGTWVLAAPLRTPEVVVRETRALVELSGGRFELGLGAGRPGGEEDAAALGVPWGSAGARVSRVAATADAVADLDAAPPIVIAGNGDRMLGIAGRRAATLALPIAPTSTADDVAAAAARARDAARPDIELALQIAGVGDEIPPWFRSQGVTADDLRAAGAVAILSGDTARDADALRALRARTGVSYLTVPGDMSARLAPLVSELAGT